MRSRIPGMPVALLAPEGALASAAADAASGAGQGGNNAGVGAGGVAIQGNSGGGAQPGGMPAAGGAPGVTPSVGAQGGQAPGQQGSSPQGPYRPEGLPDHLLGKTDQETIDRLNKAYDGSRKALGDRGAVPDSADKYQLGEVDAAIKPFTANFDKDPVYAKTREIFHKAGVTDKQFQAIVGPWMKEMLDGGMVQAPVNAEAELLKLVPNEAAGLDDAGKKTAAGRRLHDNIAWADGMKAQQLQQNGSKPNAASQAFEWLAAQAADSVQANLCIEFLRGKSQEPRPALDGQGGQGGMTKESVAARMTDPRNDPRSSKFEKAFADETDRQNRIVNA